MSKLRKLLSFLNRKEIDQVVLQAGTRACVLIGDMLQPVSQQALTLEEIETMLRGAGLKHLFVDVTDEEELEAPFDFGGHPFKASAILKNDRLRVRFSDASSASATATRRIVFNKDAPPPVPGYQPPDDKPKTGPPPTPKKSKTIPKLESPPVTEAKSPPKTRSFKSPPLTPAAREPAVEALESILKEARALGASDVHLSSDYPTQVRRAGVLRQMGESLEHEKVRHMLLALLDSKQQADLESLGYADLSCDLPTGRLRVNISRQRRGLKGCFRLVPPGPSPLDELGLPKELSKISMYHQGLVVVSGPTGAGKTTTMAALVDLFNQSRPIHIITVEDPLEIVHPPKRAVVSQREVGRHTTTFKRALKAALREDPDVIAIGELRNQDTVEMALSAAETGHLVIATMSTPSGALTIDRLIDMFPQAVQSQVRNTVSVTLKMVISQRLVPSKDGKRRHAAVELIVGSLPLCALIRDNKLFQLPSLLQQGRAYGMIRMEESLSGLVRDGLVTVEDARAFADDPKAVRETGGEKRMKP